MKWSSLLAPLAAVLGACASSQHSTGSTTVTSTATGAVVQVQLDEYTIHMPTTIPGGDITFQIKNTGTHDHNIRIQGEGIDATLPNNLSGGQTAELKAQMTPGTYKVTCPVGPHAAMGMRLELTVTGRK